ncbi:Hypothetical predicted protein, partial [Pelobates cultripes]
LYTSLKTTNTQPLTSHISQPNTQHSQLPISFTTNHTQPYHTYDTVKSTSGYSTQTHCKPHSFHTNK